MSEDIKQMFSMIRQKTGLKLEYFNLRINSVAILKREQLPEDSQVWLKHVEQFNFNFNIILL
jgi:hypothetical protein